MPTNPYYLTFGGNALTIGAGAVAVSTNPVVDPYNPLGLPPYTIRARFSAGYTPAMGDSRTLVDSTENVWDITKNSTNWSMLFVFNTSLLEILGANTTGITNVTNMFNSCSAVESGALALYQQMSTQPTPPASHIGCFSNCGSRTATGAAELAQIPSSWGGWGA